jgi:hypothetical protein
LLSRRPPLAHCSIRLPAMSLRPGESLKPSFATSPTNVRARDALRIAQAMSSESSLTGRMPAGGSRSRRCHRRAHPIVQEPSSSRLVAAAWSSGLIDAVAKSARCIFRGEAWAGRRPSVRGVWLGRPLGSGPLPALHSFQAERRSQVEGQADILVRYAFVSRPGDHILGKLPVYRLAGSEQLP